MESVLLSLTVLKRMDKMKRKKQIKKQTTILTGDTSKPPALPPLDPAFKKALDIFLDKDTTPKNCIGRLKVLLPTVREFYFTRPIDQLTQQLLYEPIRARLIELRKKESRIPPAPNDLIGLGDWIIDAERALKRKIDRTKFSAEDRLLVILGKHPHWSMAKIAQEAGCSKQHASQCFKFKEAWLALNPGRENRKQRYSGYSFDENRDSYQGQGDERYNYNDENDNPNY